MDASQDINEKIHTLRLNYPIPFLDWIIALYKTLFKTNLFLANRDRSVISCGLGVAAWGTRETFMVIEIFNILKMLVAMYMYRYVKNIKVYA